MPNLTQLQQAKQTRAFVLNELFRQAGLSRRDIATELGLNLGTVQSWTKGKIPTLENAIKLSGLLGISLDRFSELMGFSEFSCKPAAGLANQSKAGKYLQHPLGQLIKNSRINREEIADQLGVSCATVASWAVGRNVPNFDYICHLAKLLNVSVEGLAAILTNNYQNSNKKL